MLRPRKRSTYHHGDLKRALIAAAVGLTERNGANAWTVRDVARIADVSRGAPNYHFTRQELAAAVAEEGFLRLGAQLDRVVGERNADAVEQLTSAWLAYVRFATDNPHLYRAMYATGLYDSLEGTESTPRIMSDWFARLIETKAEVFGLFVDLVQAGQKQGRLRPGNASDLAKVATSLAHGLALEFVDEQLGTPTSRPKHAKEIFSLMLSGLEH
jgi:AcrR family transcriptional regulator